MGRKECVSKTGGPRPLAGRSCLQAANSNPETLEEERLAEELGFFPGNPSPCGWHKEAPEDLPLGTRLPGMPGTERVLGRCVVSRVFYCEEERGRRLYAHQSSGSFQLKSCG